MDKGTSMPDFKYTYTHTYIEGSLYKTSLNTARSNFKRN